MATQTLSKREKRALRKRRAQRRRLLAGAAILGGLVLLLVGAGLWWQGRNVAASAFDYGPTVRNHASPSMSPSTTLAASARARW